MQKVQTEISRLSSLIQNKQGTDGSWRDPFDTNIVVDAYMIILLKMLDMDDPEWMRALAARIESKRSKDGLWRLFHDEEKGNLSLTIEAYYALLYSGIKKETDEDMRKARDFIQKNGGPQKAKLFTKLMLTITGQYAWPAFLPIPLEAVLLPPTFLINIFDIAVYARVHFMPLLLLADRRFQLKKADAPDLSGLFTSRDAHEDWEELRSPDIVPLFKILRSSAASLIGIPTRLKKTAEESIKNYMIARLEPDGTSYNYFSSTFFMIFAFLSLGYSKDDPLIQQAVSGLKKMACDIDGHVHVQHTTANVWNTALYSYALQEAGISPESRIIQKASEYLQSRQHIKYGDWAVHSEGTPGGWGFSDLNTMNPDVDDTSAALRALYPMAEGTYSSSWQRGVSFLLSMQNKDGGFPAFEKDVDSKLLGLLPVDQAKYLLTDPSTPDLTGRALEFLCSYAGLKPPNKTVQNAVSWLYRHQEKDGSWFGRWGVCYIYGTWAALTGLAASGVKPDHPSPAKAIRWLKSIQNEDGGWGESCFSDIRKEYVPLRSSTLTQTAWAVDALIAVSAEPDTAIERGIAFLTENGQKTHWTNDYPAGQGLANFLYIHYHSYRHLFPLLTLSHYQKKFGN